MEVGAQIKKYRSNMGISQEELAEKVYVSRQTVSNWETGKNYPDIHSVLLLSSVFNVSLDQLIKGDVEIMKKENIKSILVDKEDNLKSAQTLANETGAQIYELQSGLTGNEESSSYLKIMKENLEILKGI